MKNKTKTYETSSNRLSIINANMYETLIDPRNMFACYDDNEDWKDLFNNHWDKFNYEAYDNQVVESFKMVYKLINKILKKEFDCYVDNFSKIISPREYNFATDRIDFDIIYTNKTISLLKKYTQNLTPKQKEFIKDNYESRSGFISFISNDFLNEIEDNLDVVLLLRFVDNFGYYRNIFYENIFTNIMESYGKFFTIKE